MADKLCSNCKQLKSFSEFPKNGGTICRKCGYLRYRSKSWSERLYQNCQIAKAVYDLNGVELIGDFEIYPGYITDLFDRQNHRCYWTNIRFDERLSGDSGTNNLYAPGISRIDFKINYTLENTVLSLQGISRMRGSIPAKDFVKLLRKIKDNL